MQSLYTLLISALTILPAQLPVSFTSHRQSWPNPVLPAGWRTVIWLPFPGHISSKGFLSKILNIFSWNWNKDGHELLQATFVVKHHLPSTFKLLGIKKYFPSQQYLCVLMRWSLLFSSLLFTCFGSCYSAWHCRLSRYREHCSTGATTETANFSFREVIRYLLHIQPLGPVLTQTSSTETTRGILTAWSLGKPALLNQCDVTWP